LSMTSKGEIVAFPSIGAAVVARLASPSDLTGTNFDQVTAVTATRPNIAAAMVALLDLVWGRKAVLIS